MKPMTSDELKAAAERRRKWQSPQNNHPHKSPYFNCDGDDPNAIYRDMKMLADAYLSRLAADAQQAKVDAEPIGREWFNENGNDVSSIIVCRDNIEYEIEAACGNPSIGIDLTVNDRYACKIIHIPHITTRGQLRKLLEALKGGA